MAEEQVPMTMENMDRIWGPELPMIGEDPDDVRPWYQRWKGGQHRAGGDMADQGHAGSAGDLRDAIRAIDQDARVQAQYMATERPYSTGPVARHPVWSDELRAESGRLREEGLISETHRHPWEQDPTAWPSADPATQERFVAIAEERATWAAMQAAFSDDVRYGEDDVTFTNANWTASNTVLGLPEETNVTAEHVITAIDLIHTYGHQGQEPIGVAQEHAEHLGDPAWQAVNDQHAAQGQLWEGGHLPGEHAALAASGQLRQFFAERARSREPEGRER